MRLRGTARGSPFSLLAILSSWDVLGAKSVPACSLPFLCSAVPEMGPGTPRPQMVEPKRRDLSKPVQTPRFKLKSTWHRDHSTYFTTVKIEGKKHPLLYIFRTTIFLFTYGIHSLKILIRPLEAAATALAGGVRLVGASSPTLKGEGLIPHQGT